MGQKGLIFLEEGGSKYLNQLNFKLHRYLGVKVQFFDSLPVQNWWRGVFHSPLCKIRSRHPRELKLMYSAESLYYVLQNMQIQNQVQ